MRAPRPFESLLPSQNDPALAASRCLAADLQRAFTSGGERPSPSVLTPADTAVIEWLVATVTQVVRHERTEVPGPRLPLVIQALRSIADQLADDTAAPSRSP